MPGLARIRYTTSHPRDVDDDLVAAHRDVPQLMPFLHLPVQSRLRPRAGGDEPPAHRRRLSPHVDRCARRGPIWRSRPISSSASPARAMRISAPRCDLVARHRLRPGLFVQIFAASRHPGRARREQVPEPVKAARLANCRRCCGDQQRAFNRAASAATLPVLFEKPGRHAGPARRPQPLSAGGPCRRAAAPDRHGHAGADHRRRIATASPGDRRRPASEAAHDAPAARRSCRRTRPTAAGSQLEFDDNLLLPLLYGERDQHLDRIERQLGVSLVPRGNRLAIAGPGLGDRDRAAGAVPLYDRLKHGPGGRRRRGRGGAAPGAGRARRQEPAACGARTPAFRTRKRRIARALGGAGASTQGDARARAGVRAGPGRHRQDLSCRRRRGRPADDRRGRAHHPVAAGGRGGRAARLPAGRSARKGRPLSAPDLRCATTCCRPTSSPKRLASGEIEVAPIAFMRGRTLAHAFVILDEAQNTTPVQMKMFLTRLGEGSRMVVTGDPTQVDLPPAPARAWPTRSRRCDGVEEVAVVRFTEKDVVRHPLVARIVGAYEARDRARPRRRGARAMTGGSADAGSSRDHRVVRGVATDARALRSPACAEDSRWPPPCAAAAAPAPPAAAVVGIGLADDAEQRRAQPHLARQGCADQRSVLPGRRSGSEMPPPGVPLLLGDVVSPSRRWRARPPSRRSRSPIICAISSCMACCICSASTTKTAPRPRVMETREVEILANPGGARPLPRHHVNGQHRIRLR